MLLTKKWMYYLTHYNKTFILENLQIRLQNQPIMESGQLMIPKLNGNFLLEKWLSQAKKNHTLKFYNQHYE